MKNSRHYRKLPKILAAVLTVLVLSAASKAQPPTSAASSPNSATRANEISRVINACAAAAEELSATRTLAEALTQENAALKDRISTAERVEALQSELNETRKAEADALRSALTAKTESITAKDAIIQQQQTLITELKRRKSSPWKRVGDILIGVAVSAILK